MSLAAAAASLSRPSSSTSNRSCNMCVWLDSSILTSVPPVTELDLRLPLCIRLQWLWPLGHPGAHDARSKTCPDYVSPDAHSRRNVNER